MARAIEIAGQAVATLVEQPQAVLGEIETAFGGSPMVGEAARRVGHRAGARQERQADPVAREELRSIGVTVGRKGVRGARAGNGDLQPFVGAGAENAGCCCLSRTLHRLHGGFRGSAVQNGGVCLVGLERIARSVELAEREQPLRFAGRRGYAQVAHGRPAAAGVVACDQAEGEVCRHVAARGHSIEVDEGALVALGCGAFEPLKGLRTVATDAHCCFPD